MRLHSLSVSAFLAFPGTETVDFDRLGEAGLFLLQGRTGAGKTALLDAVCFAFYGEVPGARQESARLRSDHASADVTTEVVLEATLRGQRIRITRAPEQERPKVRGEGTTTAPHRVQVVAIENGSERVLATRHDEARSELGDLLGMTKEQFCQVVLLPQGGFAKFLQARSDQREDLLRELFDVGRFAYVEQWLQDRRRAAKSALDDALQRVRDVVSQAKQAAGAEPPEDWGEAAGWLDEQLVVAEAQATTARGAFAAAGECREAAAAALVAARELAAQQAELTRARAALAEWEEQRPARDEAQARLDAARRAAPAHAHAVELDARAIALRDAASAAVAARKAAEAAGLGIGQETLPGFETADDGAADDGGRGTDPGPADRGGAAPDGAASAFDGAQQTRARAATMRSATGELRSVAGAAQAMLPRERALEAAIRALEQLRARAAAHAEAVATHEAALAVATERRPQLEAAVAESRDAAARLPGVEAAARAATAAADAGAERDALIARLEGGLRAAVLAARERTVAALEAHADLLRLHLDGIAAELAGRLTDGKPCAVCGAVDHPSPAHPPERGLVPEEDVRAARQAADAAVADRDARAAELADLEQRLAAARARTASQNLRGVEETSHAAVPAPADPTSAPQGDAPPPGTPAALASAVPAPADPDAAPEPNAPPPDPPLAELQSAAARVREAESATHALAARLPDAERALADLDRSKADTESRLTAAREAATQAQAQVAERAVQLDSETRAIDAARAGHPSVQARIDKLVEAAELAAAAADALDTAARCAEEHDRAQQRAIQAARKAGFATIADLRTALLSDEELERQAAAVRDYDEELTQRRAAATREELVVAADKPPPDVEGAEAAQAQAVAAADQAHSTLNEAERRHAALSALRTELAAALAAAGPARDRHTVLRELAELTAGRSDSNRLKMRLSAYVLAARLEDVAAAATVRLAQMSGGRYALEHTDDGAKGRSRGGLDLRVIDTWTNRDRPPSTLSGGETFLASLALALGLADVVTAEAGGAALETLFVDEGFGSLDDEGTLDEVLDVLDGLRDGGRAVGIVSHVPELRQRIPMQLRVEKGRAGSRLV